MKIKTRCHFWTIDFPKIKRLELLDCDYYSVLERMWGNECLKPHASMSGTTMPLENNLTLYVQSWNQILWTEQFHFKESIMEIIHIEVFAISFVINNQKTNMLIKSRKDEFVFRTLKLWKTSSYFLQGISTNTNMHYCFKNMFLNSYMLWEFSYKLYK